MNQLKHIASGEVFNVSNPPVWIGGVWECGDMRFTDENGDQYEPATIVVTYPVITPPQMRLLYTSPERICIRANLASATPDPVLHDFFTELNDPQLREVDLNLGSVQGAIEYSLNFVAPHMNPAYTAEDIERRKLEMLTGKPQ